MRTVRGTVVKAFDTKGTIRVTIPKRIWEALGRPREFELRIEGGRIVLVPRP